MNERNTAAHRIVVFLLRKCVTEDCVADYSDEIECTVCKM